MLLLHFQVGLSLYVIPKRALQELKGPQRLLPPFKLEHLQRVHKPSWHLSPIGSHMVDRNIQFTQIPPL